VQDHLERHNSLHLCSLPAADDPTPRADIHDETVAGCAPTARPAPLRGWG